MVVDPCSLAHASTYRIYLKKSGRNRIARMEDSPCHPAREILFTLTEKGIDDLPELVRSRQANILR
jgi:DNA repair protein RadA